MVTYPVMWWGRLSVVMSLGLKPQSGHRVVVTHVQSLVSLSWCAGVLLTVPLLWFVT